MTEQRARTVESLTLESTAEGFNRALAALLSKPSGVSPWEERQIKHEFALARRRARLIAEGIVDPLST
jgi:hypothetical protein